MRKFVAVLALGLGLALGATGCGGHEKPGDVVLVAHDSFAVSDAVKNAFEDETGYRLQILQTGDAGTALTRALLTVDNPEGDVFFGVDESLLSRALDHDLFLPYASPGLEHVDTRYDVDPEHRVTPVDHGEVCINVDRAWLAKHRIPEPRSMDDLVDERYKDLLVVENPATSTPGLAFLLGTVAKYGEDGWQEYWRGLRQNGAAVVDGWEQAYFARFSGAGGSTGNRPIVVSYASSPPAEVLGRKPQPLEAPTGIIEDSCFRQVEFAGVLRGAKNEEGAHALVDFMLSRRFQEDVPLSMYVFPVDPGAALPPVFERFAVVPQHPLELDPDVIDENRDRWIDEWTDVVVH